MGADYYGAFQSVTNELAATKRELNARIAQLEDELTTCHADALHAAEVIKPPVNIDTGTHIGAGAAVQLPNAATGTGLGILAAVLGVVGLVWALIWKRKGR